MEKGKSGMAVLVVVVMMIGLLGSSEAQSPDTSCAASLTPCANYINATNPPASCCNPLKVALSTQKECLCKIFNDPTLLKSFGINVTDALTLPTRCKISGASATMCTTASAPSPSTSTTTTTTPAASGENGAGLVAWSGASFVAAAAAVASLLF